MESLKLPKGYYIVYKVCLFYYLFHNINLLLYNETLLHILIELVHMEVFLLFFFKYPS